MTYLATKSRRPSSYTYPGSYLPQQAPLGGLNEAETLIVNRLYSKYSALRTQLLAQAQKMMNVPFWDLSLDQLFGAGSISKSVGQSIVNAVANFDKRMARINAGDLWWTDDFVKDVGKAVDAWTKDAPNPTWSDMAAGMKKDAEDLGKNAFDVAVVVSVGLASLAVLAGITYFRGLIPDFRPKR